MSLPKTISGWCMWLFFLFVGLAAFVPMFAGGFFPMLTGAFALIYAIAALFGK